MKLGEIVARIADMMARDDLAPQIRAEVLLALKRYERELWYFNETRGAAVELEAGRGWYDNAKVFSVGSGWDLGRWDITAWDSVAPTLIAVPLTSLLNVDYARLIPHAGGFDDAMRQIDYRTFERWQEGSPSAGQPQAFARYGGKIGIWPTPVGADVLYLSGAFKPLMPVADNDGSVFFREAQELIESCACANVYEKFLRDYDAAAAHRGREAIAIASLRAEAVHKKATGRLRVNC